MTLLTITRDDFISRYEKENTRCVIHNAFLAFDKFLTKQGQNEADFIIKLKKLVKSEEQDEQTEVYRLLDRMITLWSKDKSAVTIRAYFDFVKQWLRYNGIRIEDYLIKQFVKFPKETKSRPVPITREIIKKLVDLSPLEYKVYFLMGASGGFRSKKELLGLQVSDIDFKIKPTKVTVRKELAKNNIERITFITPEATEYLQELIRNKKPTEQVFDFSYKMIHDHITNLRPIVGMADKEGDGKKGRYHLRLNKLRKFCETNISNSPIPGTESDEFAHAILGHEKYLMTYYEVPDAEMAKMYEAAIPKLTITKEHQYKDENENLKQKVSEVEELKRKQIEQDAQIKRLEQLVQSKK